MSYFRGRGLLIPATHDCDWVKFRNSQIPVAVARVYTDPRLRAMNPALAFYEAMTAVMRPYLGKAAVCPPA